MLPFHPCRTSTFAGVVVVAAAVVLATAQAGRGNDAVTVEPALKPDPAVTKIIDGLGDNSSAELPPIKTVGEWNAVAKEYGLDATGPRSRDYSIKAVWMPDRQRAFFCGANHGSPHRLNDAWEYDLPSNTWVLLFAPDPSSAKGVTTAVEMEIPAFEPQTGGGDKQPPGGTEPKPAKKVYVVQTERGGPTHYGHTWWGLAYDPNMKAALWMNKPIGKSPQKYLAQEGHPKDEIYRGPALWAFYPATKQWKPVLTHPPRPGMTVGAALEYVPDLGGVVWYFSNWKSQGMWVYHPAEGAWENLKPNGGRNLYHFNQAPKREAVMAYDASTKTVVAVLNRTTFHYDLAKNEWSRVIDESGDDSFDAYDSRSPFYYDPVSEVCLLYSPRTPDTVWSYESAERKWTRNRVDGPPGPARSAIGYFDEARNVLVVNDAATTWVFRHRASAK